MDIKYLGKVDSKIIEITQAINRRHLDNFDFEIGVYKSRQHRLIKWTERGNINFTPAIVVPKKDYPWLKDDVPEIQEIEKLFEKNLLAIMWLGQEIMDVPKINIGHLLAHELKHVLQMRQDQIMLYKDRLLSFILTTSGVPSEVDANYFADAVLKNKSGFDYDWISETNKLFLKNERLLTKLYDDIRESREKIVIKGHWHEEFSSNQSKRALFKYYFDRAMRYI